MLLDFSFQKNRDPAECEIIINGQAAADLYPFLGELTVETSRQQAWTATLNFETRRDEKGQWLVQDSDLLETWAEIEIIVLFGSYSETLFKGYIREIKTELPEDAGSATVTVECQDQSIRLDRTHHKKKWGSEEVPTTDQFIAMEILQQYGLYLHPDSAAGQEGIVTLAQDDSDISFLKKRAEFNGYELIFYPDEVYFGPYRLDSEAQSTLMVYAGEASNCKSLSVTADGHHPDAISFDLPAPEGEEGESEDLYSDLKEMGPIPANSLASLLEPNIQKMSGEGGADIERQLAKAQAKINDIDLHRVKGEGELDGTLYGAILKVGMIVGVDGLGSTQNGTYYVDTVSHSFSMEGYRQQFVLLRNAYGDNLDSISPINPTIAGLM